MAMCFLLLPQVGHCACDLWMWLCVVCVCAATGDGDCIMQFCPSFHIVQKLKEGCSPAEACSEVVRNMAAHSREGFEVGVVALDMKVR